jgi:hypothetical protein
VSKRIPIVISLVLCFGFAAMAQSTGSSLSPSRSQDKQALSFRYGGGDLNESERAGAEIWFNATAGNSRFHTYVFQQRLGVSIDWYRVLNADAREQRFNRWGLINDPDCCKPGDPNCPAKSMDDTYGFDYCPGDDTLLQFVGKTGYKDPACDFTDAPLAPDDPHGPKDLRQSACDLEFGTSTGALGLRKFPNPNFSKSQWLKTCGPLDPRRQSSDRRIARQYHRGRACRPRRGHARVPRARALRRADDAYFDGGRDGLAVGTQCMRTETAPS